MNKPVTELSAEALKLPPEDRLKLVDTILASIEPANADIAQSWDEEIISRVAAFERGECELEDAEGIMAEARAALMR